MEIGDALELARSGDLAGAIRLLGEIAGGHPASEAGRHRAYLLWELGEDEQARSAFAMIFEASGDAGACYYLAMLELRRGDVSEARRWFEKGIQIDPGRPEAREALERIGRFLQPASETAPAMVPLPERGGAEFSQVVAALEADAANTFPSSVHREVGEMLHALVRILRPACVVETGTHIAFSSLWIAAALEANGKGFLHSFDVFLEMPGYVSPVAKRRLDGRDVAAAHLSAAGLGHRVAFHKGDSADLIRRLGRDGAIPPVNLAFIDGDHYIRGVLADFRALQPMLAPGAVLVFHDVSPEGSSWLGPRKLLDRLADNLCNGVEVLNLPTADGLGIGIVRLRETGKDFSWTPSLRDLVHEALFSRVRLNPWLKEAKKRKGY